MSGMHAHHLHRIRFTEISEIYYSETIKNIAFSMIGVFIPIFLLKSGVSLPSVCILYITHSVVRLMMEPLVGKAIASYGAKHILAFSYPFSLVFISLFAIYPYYPLPVWAIAIFWAISDSLHWVSYHSAFSRAKHRTKAGREIGRMSILNVLAGTIGPLLGGLVAYFFGLNITFVIAAFLMLGAMVPLFQTYERIKSDKLSYKGIVKVIKYDMVAYGSLGVDIVAGVTVWPLYIYFVIHNYFNLGAIISISLLLSTIFVVFVGRISDRSNKKLLIAVGSIGLAVANVLRNVATTVLSAFGVYMFGSVISHFMGIPMFSIFYNHADKVRRIEYVVIMEMCQDFTRLCTWLILFVVSLSFNNDVFFKVSFLAAAIALIFINMVKVKPLKLTVSR